MHSALLRKPTKDGNVSHLLPSRIAQSPAPQDPQPHQKDAIKDIVAMLATEERAQAHMACGTGKTLVGQMVAHQMGSRILLCEPTLSLVAQSVRAWQQNYHGTKPEFLVLCSDNTVVRPNSDEVFVRPEDINARVTRSAAEAARILAHHPDIVLVSTYQSLPLLQEAMKNKAIAPFDIAIADEAHRTAGAVDALFSAFHDAGSVRANKRLYLTATPRVYEVDDSIAYSMDNEEIFGKIAHSLPLSRAIEKGLLCDYQVVVAAVSERDQELLASHDGISKRYALAEVALKRSLEKYHLRKVLTFHSRIHDAERIAAHLPAVVGDDTWVRTIKGNTPTATRTHLLKMFGEHQGTAILTNCKCLSEGVDVPSIDGIVFFDPRSSEIDVVQAVGRAIRLSSTKAVGTIVLPVMVPGNVDEEGFLSSTAFKPIVQVLKALRAHDDRIEGRFRVQAEKPSEMESVLRERHIHLDLGAISETLKAKITTKVISLGNGVRGAYLTEDAIREAGREYYKLHKRLPTKESTEPVPGMEGENWKKMNTAGQTGLRGLEKGMTLSKIFEPLKHELGLDNTLTEDAIREAGREYYKLYQKLPSAQSTEPVPGMETERWNILDAAGWHGRRGLDKGRTLARILEPLKGELGVDNTLTEDAIITAARAYYKLHAKLPNLNSTEPVPGIEGDSWRKINAAGGNGHRGLEAGRTLAKILEPIRGELGFDNTLTEEAIREAARAYHKLYLKIPTKDSTEPVPGMEGESWKKIYAAGYLGLRGLEKGRSLTKILEPLRDGLLRDTTLTEDAILKAAKEYYELHGTLPTLSSTEPVPGMEGETWAKIYNAGKQGYRGLEKGTTLPVILEPLKNELGLSNTLTEEAIREAAKAYYALHHKLPTKCSTEPVPGMARESWMNIAAAGHKGYRGLEKGRTLPKILEPLKRELGS